MTAIAWGFGAVYALWILFLAVMNLQRARDSGTLTGVAHALGLPVMYIGLALDFAVNFLVLSVLMAEFPREWLVTARLTRHAHDIDGWRKSMTLWIGANLLDAFDPSGKHIK